MISLIAVLLSQLWACEVDNNDPDTGINPDCNYAGRCHNIPFPPFKECDCCVPANRDSGHWCSNTWICDPNDPSVKCTEYSGSSCSEVDQYYYVSFGFRADDSNSDEPSDVTCYTDAKDRELNGDFLPPSVKFDLQVQYVANKNGWPGGVEPSPVCDTCTPAYPCTVGTDDKLNVTSGNTYGFQVDFNEYYSASCSTGGIILNPDSVPDCDANYDYGQLAYETWKSVRGDIEGGDTSFIDAVNDLLWSDPGDNNDNLGLSWSNTKLLAMAEQITKVTKEDVYITLPPTLPPTHDPTETPTHSPTNYPTMSPTFQPTKPPTHAPTETPTHSPTNYPTMSPTLHPTKIPTEFPTNLPTQTPTSTPTNTPTQTPTSSPTNTPTQTPTSECKPYTNNVEDMEFQGVGSDCRAGLNSSWPGGLSCESPYIVCLPQENTPAAFGGEPYKTTTYRYSVDECLQECANDQRCLGIEFVADTDSSLGNCNLIDDIPPEITSEISGFTYNPLTTYENLDSSVTNGNALCFEKKDDCFPYFEANDLNDVMLNCYCPNNRKGSYTKKVKRIVANTRFCGDDSEVDIRIQKAQANRMFHLCENWCLFNTNDPEGESWYWDPWKTCWREQYAGVGTHMSYCNRVIRSPDTIEMQFINHRTNLFCQTPTPTASPSIMSSTWYMAEAEDSCEDVCMDNGMVCNENLIASVVDPIQSEGYFTEAGVTCALIEVGEVDWALPGYEISSATCLTRNNATENTGCNWAIGIGYKGLCACV